MKKAMEEIKGLIKNGMDFSEAVFKVSEKTGISFEALEKEYDNE